MSTSLTRAGVAHAGVISALHGACFADAWDGPAIGDILAMPGSAGFIGRNGGGPTPQGFILFRVAAGEAEIVAIGVVAAARRAGLAAALLRAAVELAGREGAGEMFLEVGEDNKAALAFYEKAGFAVAGRRAGYYRRTAGRADALVCRLEISFSPDGPCER